jgi:hypothetical protein
MDGIRATTPQGAWNKGKLVGQKAPFKLQEVWAIRIRLQMQGPPARPCPIRPGDRQQAARLRPGQAARPRRVPR